MYLVRNGCFESSVNITPKQVEDRGGIDNAVYRFEKYAVCFRSRLFTVDARSSINFSGVHRPRDYSQSLEPRSL